MKYTTETAKTCPKSDLKQIYDTNDNVLFGSRYTKGKVTYNYVPGELMESGIPFIVNSSVLYDGKGNADLPEGTTFMHYAELPAMFTDNEFGN